MDSRWQVDGATRLIAHLAYPSAHLRTPQLFNARLRERGINAVLVPWQVHPDNLSKVMDALRLSESVQGLLVTLPHKEAAAALCDFLDGPAATLSVVNVARKDNANRWHGRTLDGVGFVAGLEAAGHKVAGRRALLLGAGGVAASIAEALLGAGLAELVIANRSVERAKRLVTRLKDIYPAARIATGPADATGFHLVINGTSLGMKQSDPLPLDAGTIVAGTIVAEVIMEPAVTALLKEATARGAIAHAGLHMLTGQIDPFIDFLLSDLAGPAYRTSPSDMQTREKHR